MQLLHEHDLFFLTLLLPWQPTPCQPKSNCYLPLPSLKAWWLLSVARILRVLISFSMPIALYDCWWKKVRRDLNLPQCKISCCWHTRVHMIMYHYIHDRSKPPTSDWQGRSDAYWDRLPRDWFWRSYLWRVHYACRRKYGARPPWLLPVSAIHDQKYTKEWDMA